MTIFGYKVIFQKVRKKKKKTLGFTAKPWTPEETQLALDLSNDGLSSRAISEKMTRRTPASVASRLNKIRKR